MPERNNLSPVCPIPSFHAPVNGTAIFREDQRVRNPFHPGKKKLKVLIESASLPGNFKTLVWIYTLDHSIILGPRGVSCGEILTYDIDDRKLGVLVQSNTEVIVDVWIGE
jgi:hypothetical protein